MNYPLQTLCTPVRTQQAILETVIKRATDGTSMTIIAELLPVQLKEGIHTLQKTTTVV